MPEEKAGSATEVKPNAFGVIPDVDIDTELPAESVSKTEVVNKGKTDDQGKENDPIKIADKRVKDAQAKMHEATTKASLLEKELETYKKFSDLLPYVEKLKALKEGGSLENLEKKDEEMLDSFLESPQKFVESLKSEIFKQISEEKKKEFEANQIKQQEDNKQKSTWVQRENEFKQNHSDYEDLVPKMTDEFNRLLTMGIDARDHENPSEFLYNQVKGKLTDIELEELKQRREAANKQRELDIKNSHVPGFAPISSANKREVTDEGDKIVNLARKQGIGSLF